MLMMSRRYSHLIRGNVCFLLLCADEHRQPAAETRSESDSAQLQPRQTLRWDTHTPDQTPDVEVGSRELAFKEESETSKLGEAHL